MKEEKLKSKNLSKIFGFLIFEPRDPFQRVDRAKISQKSVHINKNHFKIIQNQTKSVKIHKIHKQYVKIRKNT